eukprot:6197893-Pleurochrysis_carterae.AAC.1
MSTSIFATGLRSPRSSRCPAFVFRPNLNSFGKNKERSRRKLRPWWARKQKDWLQFLFTIMEAISQEPTLFDACWRRAKLGRC